MKEYVTKYQKEIQEKGNPTEKSNPLLPSKSFKTPQLMSLKYRGMMKRTNDQINNKS